MHGHLVQNFANPMDHVRRTVETYKQENTPIKLFAAHDNGLSDSERTVMTIKELIKFAIIFILGNHSFFQLGIYKKKYSADGRARLKPIENEPNDDFEGVSDYVEGL